jgi:hypothetical protein
LFEWAWTVALFEIVLSTIEVAVSVMLFVAPRGVETMTHICPVQLSPGSSGPMVNDDGLSIALEEFFGSRVALW